MRVKKMKNKNILVISIILFFSFCKTSQYLTVNIPFDKKDDIDFKKYQNILYKDITIKFPLKSYNPQPEIKNFFLNDFSKALEKEVKYLDNETDYYLTPDKFLQELKDFPESLLLTGKLNVDIKTRSYVKEERNKEGIKKKFVKRQIWKMDVELLLVDANTSEIVFKKDFEEKIMDLDPKNPKYNFDTPFFKITDQFLKSLLKKQKLGKRYLLLN